MSGMIYLLGVCARSVSNSHQLKHNCPILGMGEYDGPIACHSMYFFRRSKNGEKSTDYATSPKSRENG